ncbi:MAG: hypothetical protein Q8N30_04055 [Methylococcales bacterium]|nr:hypothetical protein [Methylococcales bacterium]
MSKQRANKKSHIIINVNAEKRKQLLIRSEVLQRTYYYVVNTVMRSDDVIVVNEAKLLAEELKGRSSDLKNESELLT